MVILIKAKKKFRVVCEHKFLIMIEPKFRANSTKWNYVCEPKFHFICLFLSWYLKKKREKYLKLKLKQMKLELDRDFVDFFFIFSFFDLVQNVDRWFCWFLHDSFRTYYSWKQNIISFPKSSLSPRMISPFNFSLAFYACKCVWKWCNAYFLFILTHISRSLFLART